MNTIRYLAAAALCGMAAPASAAVALATTGYYSLKYDTAKGTATMQLAGEVRLGVSSMTLLTPSVILNGTTGFITAVGYASAPVVHATVLNVSTISAENIAVYTNEGANLVLYCNNSGECAFGGTTSLVENMDVSAVDGAYIGLRRRDTSVGTGDDIGGITFRSEDTSTGGTANKAAIEVEATTSYGSGDTNHNTAMYIYISSAASLNAYASETYFTLTSTGMRGQANMALDFTTITAREYFSVPSSFTLSGGTLTFNRQTCSGVDCVSITTRPVLTNYVSFAGLEHSTVAYVLEGDIICDVTTSCQIEVKVINTSVTASGYYLRQEARGTDGSDADNADSNTGTACFLTYAGENVENSPQHPLKFKMYFTLIGNKMYSWSKALYNGNGGGDIMTEIDNSCTFNDPDSVRPGITSIQVIDRNNKFTGMLRLRRENY